MDLQTYHAQLIGEKIYSCIAEDIDHGHSDVEDNIKDCIEEYVNLIKHSKSDQTKEETRAILRAASLDLIRRIESDVAELNSHSATVAKVFGKILD